MSLGQRSMPILSVKDVLASADFYRGLGFTKAGHWLNDDGSANFAIVVMDTITLGLMRDTDARGSGENWVSYCYVSDIEALSDLAQSNGIAFARGMVDQPYGCRDFEIIDLDQNRLCFGQDMSPTETGPGL